MALHHQKFLVWYLPVGARAVDRHEVQVFAVLPYPPAEARAAVVVRAAAIVLAVRVAAACIATCVAATRVVVTQRWLQFASVDLRQSGRYCGTRARCSCAWGADARVC